MKSKSIMTLAAIAVSIGLAGFSTTGCNLSVPASVQIGDTTGAPPGLDDGGNTGQPGGNVVRLEDSTLELEGPSR